MRAKRTERDSDEYSEIPFLCSRGPVCFVSRVQITQAGSPALFPPGSENREEWLEIKELSSAGARMNMHLLPTR